MYTRDGKVHLAPEVFVERLSKLMAEDHFQLSASSQGEIASSDEAMPPVEDYRLITRRSVTTHNSWTHNYAPFLEREEHRNFVYMHSEDMAREGFAETEVVRVSSGERWIELEVRALDDLMPGVVAVPHGWGHEGSGLSVARSAGGANVNILHPSGRAHVDDISGMSTLTGVPVSPTRAAGV